MTATDTLPLCTLNKSNKDIITGKPRTENIQYTCMTDQQRQNVAQKANHSTLFAPPVVKDFKVGVNGESKTEFKQRYVDSYSQHLTRTGSGYGNQRFCYVDKQWNRFPPQAYNTCKPLASVKWGTYKCGTKTAGYFYGEPVHKMTTIDMYRRNPTNQPGPTHIGYGRPAEGYYSQKYPADTTWNESRVPLNRTKVLQTVPPKTKAEYEEIEQYQRNQLENMKEQWPHYSEYTDRFAAKTRILPVLDQMERRKQHINAVSQREIARNRRSLI